VPRSARQASAAGLCLACLLPALGCAGLGLGLARMLPDAARECPGRLLPTQQIEGEFRSRQRVRVQGEDLDWQLELVAEKRADLLVLVGLDAFGGKLFTVTQRGSELSVERPRGRLPRPPTDLLRDFHRARLADAPPEPGVTLERPQPGEVTIEHERCGYRTRLVTIEEATLPARREPGL
jgi:Protein of unknown function (DUF3261)